MKIERQRERETQEERTNEALVHTNVIFIMSFRLFIMTHIELAQNSLTHMLHTWTHLNTHTHKHNKRSQFFFRDAIVHSKSICIESQPKSNYQLMDIESSDYTNYFKWIFRFVLFLLLDNFNILKNRFFDNFFIVSNAHCSENIKNIEPMICTHIDLDIWRSCTFSLIR